MAATQPVAEGVSTHWSLLVITLFSISSPDTAAGCVAPEGGDTMMPAAPAFSNVRLSTVTLLAFTIRPLIPPAALMMVLAAVPPFDSMVMPLPTAPDGTVFDDPAAIV